MYFKCLWQTAKWKYELAIQLSKCVEHTFKCSSKFASLQLAFCVIMSVFSSLLWHMNTICALHWSKNDVKNGLHLSAFYIAINYRLFRCFILSGKIATSWHNCSTTHCEKLKNISMKLDYKLNHLINLTYTIAPTITSSTKIIIPIISLFVATLKKKDLKGLSNI